MSMNDVSGNALSPIGEIALKVWLWSGFYLGARLFILFRFDDNVFRLVGKAVEVDPFLVLGSD